MIEKKHDWEWESGPMTLSHAVYEWERTHFCGCGMPNEVMLLIKRALDTYKEKGSAAPLGDYEAGNAEFPDDAIRYLLYYELDRMGWSEHGSSVPGWLTERGLAFRNAIDEFGAERLCSMSTDLETGEAFPNQ